ncbi:hypothetical protein HPB48_019751 [Haemaphysalis longicornis]|uniref:Uncharacterized protein n=1 Tax=Haemaphysalis longicornis TaxID=44386 RepID=A0A9J6FLU2_HAELO|nr:hypothetical protein HPB48_019751 [Haemaphysalis longicornis]
MNVEHWKTKLSMLDFTSECSVPTSEDSCWLCEDLATWNAVLHPLKLHLAEQTVGVLCLHSFLYKAKNADDFKELDTPYNSFFFAVWLPKKHKCVQEIKLYEGLLHCDRVTIPDSVAQNTLNLRSISIEMSSHCWDVLLSALHPIEQLEELELGDFTVSESLNSRLAQLILTNSDSLKAVHLYGTAISCSIANIFVSSILKCNKLKELSFHGDVGSAGLRDFATLLKATETLEKLFLVEDQDSGPDQEENNEKILAAVGDLLRRNTTLTELRFRGHQHLLIDILNALESNNVLRCFSIDTYETDSVDPGHVFALALKSMLARNKGLHSLCLVDFDLDYHTAGLMSEGLQTNTTLKCLDLSGSILGFLALRALCSVLSVNRTLCSLMVGDFQADKSESIALSTELAKLGCYQRVQMAWHQWDTPGLSSAVLDLSLCPTELTLCTTLFSEDAFCTICNAVASSSNLKKLTVYFSNGDSTHVENLCKALRENTSLKYITLHEDTPSLHSAATAAESLSFNNVVVQLHVFCNGMDETSAAMFFRLLVRNDSLRELEIYSRVKFAPFCKDTLCLALAQNTFITSGFFYDGLHDCSETVEAVLQRNVTHLHQAARFVLRKNTGKAYAEAFEHFSSKSQLLRQVMWASDMSKTEAKAAVKAARLYIQRNYLFINRVVCHELECHAGEGTQIDQLNHDCWLAIAKYLKVSDIAG